MYANGTVRQNTGLGQTWQDTAIQYGQQMAAEYAGERVRTMLTGDDASKAQRALSPGAACAGPYSEAQLLSGIEKLSSADSTVLELRRAVLVKDWLQGIGIETDNTKLARAAVFLAHGGKDCQAGATEARVADAVKAVIDRSGVGAATYNDPTYVQADSFNWEPWKEQVRQTIDQITGRVLGPGEEPSAGPRLAIAGVSGLPLLLGGGLLLLLVLRR